MNRMRLFVSAAIVAVLVTAGHAQNPPKPLIANAKPVRSCESLASVALPDTTIESATVDPDEPRLCRVSRRRRTRRQATTSGSGSRFRRRTGTAGSSARAAADFPAAARPASITGGAGICGRRDGHRPRGRQRGFALDANGRLTGRRSATTPTSASTR